MSQLHDESFVLLQNTLFKYCDEGETGTVLIRTSGNKSCLVSLVDGQITACTLGRLKGLEAVLEIDKVGCVKASITKGIDLLSWG